MSRIKAEYLWLDGCKPTAKLRSKTKILEGAVSRLEDIPVWIDGSSTEQAVGHASDCLLQPVHFVPDPIRGGEHILVMCEVLTAEGMPHVSNTRARLRQEATRTAPQEPWFGIEQEYTMIKNGKPLGWPADGYPRPQGDFYCGVGSEMVSGRPLVEAHMEACLKAGLKIAGVNAEVMLGQWEFQIGPVPPLRVGDELWIARWLLLRLGEDMGIDISLAPKPVAGDWNGTGAHTNFSTRAMRDSGGLTTVDTACRALSTAHEKHIAVYGAGNEARLTGKHETCSITQFRYGVSDRGASIRIPIFTAKAGCGYLEDRRPAANMDPYQVCAMLLETACK